MAELVKFEVKELPDMLVVGKAVRPNLDMKENPIPAFWGQCFKDDTFAILAGLSDYHLNDAYVGWMSDWTAGDGKFTYICGMLMKADAPVPEGFVSKKVSGSKVAIGWIQGQEKETYTVAHQYTQKTLEENGYVVDEEAGWCMELYACPRFTEPMENGEVILDYYIPCKKA